MRATPGPLPAGPGWAYELVWDGWRAMVDIGPEVPGGIRITGLAGEDVTGGYPELHPLRDHVVDTLLDGEIVTLRAGRPSTDALRERTGVRDAGEALRLAVAAPVTYLASDIVRLYGVELSARPFAERRATLERLGLDGPHWTTSPCFDDGEATLDAAGRHGLDGVVAKRLDSPYRPGAGSAEWVSTRLGHAREAVVGAWYWGRGARSASIGGLLVGYYDGMELRYAGPVGRGLDTPALRGLLLRLAPLVRDTPPFAPAEAVPAEQAQRAVWCEPSVVVRVAHTGWTPDGLLRQPRYRGVAVGHDPRAVHRG